MSIVGLMFGNGAKASRPAAASAASVATSASTFDVGCVRPYQANPAASVAKRMRNDASSQLIASPPLAESPRTGRWCGSWVDLQGELAAQALGALLGQQRVADDPRGLGREVPAAAEDLGGGAVGDRPPL